MPTNLKQSSRMQSMDLDSEATLPKVTVGQEVATYLACSGILHKAWEEINSASISNANTFVVKEHEDVVFVTFPPLNIEEYVLDKNTLTAFSDSLKGDDDMPALVHKGALNRFLKEISNFEAEMGRFLNSKQERAIIIVGQSMGGAVATLATLWLLGKRARQISPYCITFGSPLVGDDRLVEAISREDWSGKFCHVVSKHDIVPGMLLAPFESIAGPLNTIVPGESGYTSPYKPIGNYMFCSNQGAPCIEDSEAALKMLHFTMQSKEGKPFDEIAGACISDHKDYGRMLEHITDRILSVTGMKVVDSVSDDSFEMGTALELQAMDIGDQNDQALIALREAVYLKNKHDINIEKLNAELSENQSNMTQLEWYKTRTCEDNGPGYYDSFKQKNNKRDITANNYRIKLAIFWDEIVDKVEKHELPSDFQTQNKWINAGNTYRKLVEPLDIVDYYYKQKGNGNYLSQGVRPRRHMVLEKWLNEKSQTRIGRDKKPRTGFASLTEDSCFWAGVEEALKALENLKQKPGKQQEVMKSHELKDSLAKFEDYVWSMIKNKSISVEVFLEGSTFMLWWQLYTDFQLESPGWQSSSPLFDFMQNEKWKLKI